MKISVIVLIKNGAKFLPKLLDCLKKQQGDFEIELVVIDSGSTDGSWEYIKRIKESRLRSAMQNFGGQVKNLRIKVLKIKPEDFAHGKTRNLAVNQAGGEIVVFLTQDALPVDNNWLEILIKPLSGEKVAGVFGRQIPYPKTNLIEQYFYDKSYTNKMRIMGNNDADSFSNQNIFFSNVNAAVKKEFLLKFPFREDLVMSEDQWWGREVLKNGYQIIYQPDAVVWHSHNYNLKQLFKRYYQSGYSQKQMGLKGNVWKKGAGTTMGLFGYILRKNPLLLPYALVYVLVKGGAFWLGRYLWFF